MPFWVREGGSFQRRSASRVSQLYGRPSSIYIYIYIYSYGHTIGGGVGGIPFGGGEN